MWAFFSKRIRMWVLLAVAVPVAGWLLGKVADVVESRRGPSGLSRTLRRSSGWVNRNAKGPLAHHPSDQATTSDEAAAEQPAAAVPAH